MELFEINLRVAGENIDPEQLAFAIAEGVNSFYSRVEPIATISVEIDGVTEFTVED